jgi:N-acetylglucosamine-6-sulfatase
MGVAPVPVQRGLRTFTLVAGLAMFAAVLLAAETTSHPARAQVPGRPNIVLIVTDDQRYDTLRVMPEVRRLLVTRGMTLRRAIVTNPLCCPSRATIFTGRYSHTTGVYSNIPPNGGWSVFQPSESDTIATALDDVGYRTALIGKYMNGYGGESAYVPPGWDRWFVMTGVGRYFGYTVYDDIRGHVGYGSRPKDYSTDLLRRQAVSFIRNAPQGTPLLLVVTPFAPHDPAIAAPRHEGTFASAPVPLGPAVDEADVSDKPAYIADQARGIIGTVKRARDRWEALLAVDELVSRVMGALVETGRSADTLVIFTSDNGMSNREHRWRGKQVPYEESIRVPMIVRLPGWIPAGTVSNALVSNVDLAPTIADFAGTSISADGVSLRPLWTDRSSSVRDSVLLEHIETAPAVPTYCGVRTPSFTFVHYSTGEEELYDLLKDPRQLQNVASTRPTRTDQLRSLTRSLCRPLPPGFSW